MSLNKQKGKLLSPDASLLSHFGNSRIHFGNLRKQKGKSLTHLGRFRKQKGKLLTHLGISRIHLGNFRKQTGKSLAHLSNFRNQEDSLRRENLFESFLYLLKPIAPKDFYGGKSKAISLQKRCEIARIVNPTQLQVHHLWYAKNEPPKL